MFCTKCGSNNAEGTLFCINCGSKLQGSGNMQGQNTQGVANNVSQYGANTGYSFQSSQKKNKTLILGLIIAIAVLTAAVIVLTILLLGKNQVMTSANQGNAGVSNNQDQAGIIGTWYEKTGYGGKLTFNQSGSFDMDMMGMPFSGTYTFDKTMGRGKLTIDYYGTKITENIYMADDGTLEYKSLTYTRNYVEQQNLSDALNSARTGVTKPLPPNP